MFGLRRRVGRGAGIEEVGVVGEVGRGRRTIELPELLAGRLEAHPTFVEYTEAVF